jgi:acyl-CoA dehydrogenase
MIRDPDTLNALLDSVERFVRERLVPAEHVVQETDEIPEDIVAEMKELGLFGLTIPEEYGGLGLTMEEEALVIMVMGQTSPAFRSLFGTTVGIGSQGILLDGLDWQKTKYLSKLATGEILASFALTEPEAGSDAVRPPPSLPKLATDSSQAERPFLRPFFACGGLRFPLSARRYRLQALLARQSPAAKIPFQTRRGKKVREESCFLRSSLACGGTENRRRTGQVARQDW